MQTKLTVVIERLPTRRLVAQVSQNSASADVRGRNLIGRGVRRIRTAMRQSEDRLGPDYLIEWNVKAEPDLVRAKKPKPIAAAPVA